MREKNDPDLFEQQIEASLAEELDEVAPRSDLWLSILDGVRRLQPEPKGRWLRPSFGSAAILGITVVAMLLFVVLVFSLQNRNPNQAASPLQVTTPLPTGTTVPVVPVLPLQESNTNQATSTPQITTPLPLVAPTPLPTGTAVPVVPVLPLQESNTNLATSTPQMTTPLPTGTPVPLGTTLPLVTPTTVPIAPTTVQPSSTQVPRYAVAASPTRAASGGGSGGSAKIRLDIGGTDPVNDAPYDANFFKNYGVNPFIDTEDDNLSTFAMDVDTASYAVARRFVMDGHLPNPDSVRVEEFVNYFDQEYEPPAEQAFAIHVEGAPSPFGGEKLWLMRVGLQGRVIEAEDRDDASLIFVIDVSGSMARENRLELVKRALILLVDELRPTDEVGIVIYGSRGQVLLNPTSGENRNEIVRAIDELTPGGSTNAEEGLTLGYQMAAKTVQPGRISRVILLSDGVANVGRTGPDSILESIKKYVNEGVMLSTVGFGMGNFNDVLMEQLANDGNGNYAYVDSLKQARRVFVEDLTGLLQVIAKDAKVQVDFNPEVVSRYRLLGYENRRVADQDFRNDAVDAGEVGAGHSVTALYEVKFHQDTEGRMATVYIRYEDADTGDVREIGRDFFTEELNASLEDASPRFQLDAVVAEYAEVLRESFWAQDGSLEDVLMHAQRTGALLPDDPDVAEFVDLVTRAERIAAEDSP